MLRVRPTDSTLRMKFAGVLLRDGFPLRALDVLDGLPAGLSPGDKRAALELQRRALSELTAGSRMRGNGLKNYRDRLSMVNRELAKYAPPIPLKGAQKGDSYQSALARADYRGAAALSFDAMKHADDIDRRRDFFFKGIAALQSGNLPLEAFRAGEAHLDGLSGDRRALEFLARAALAAGRPERAQGFMKRALGMKKVVEQSDTL